MTQWTLYCHTHVESGRRYIGLTKRTWQERWRGHVHLAKRSTTHFARAIRKYGKDAFSHEVLEVCLSLEVANLAEECWIEFYGTRDPSKGFNLAPGGAHTPHPITNPWDDPEYRAKALANNNIRHCLTPEAKAAQLASLRSPESVAKRSAQAKELMNSPETKAKRRVFQDDPAYKQKISETTKAALADPEVRMRVSMGVREMWQRPEVREKIISAMNEAQARPEVKMRTSMGVAKSWQDPEIRAKRLAAFQADATRPEKRAKLSAVMTGKRHTPESVAHQRELYLKRSSMCKFCDATIAGKRSCIKGRVACLECYGLHKRKGASFLRPDETFV